MKKFYTLGALLILFFILTPLKSVFAMDVSILSTFILQERSGYICSDSISCSSSNSVYNLVVDGETTYVCAGGSSSCSSTNSVYKASKQSDGTYYICSGDSIYCTYINRIYQIKKYSTDTSYICSDSISCSSLSALYKVKESYGGDYNICSGDSIGCSSLSALYKVNKSSTDIYVCSGDEISCSFLNYIYKFTPKTTNNSVSSGAYDDSILCPLNSSYKNSKCYCNDGYKINTANTGCEIIVCSTNSQIVNNQCVCNSGYVMSVNGCISHTEDCQLTYGFNTNGIKNDKGSSSCNCNLGYKWNELKTACVINDSISEKATTVGINSVNVDLKLSNKLKGKILLQIEDRGQAYYVNPKDGKKYYMADGNRAYEVMRTFGIGITNKDLEKIKINKTLAKKSSGKIFLQVESKGEAYYIDSNGTAHYLKDGQAAYTVMRNLGLGITNDNLNKIAEGSF